MSFSIVPENLAEANMGGMIDGSYCVTRVLNYMSEKMFTIENVPEHIPSVEEVMAVFERITNGKPYTELKRKEDEKGLYVLEMKLVELDEKGRSTEYWYKRDGSIEQGTNNRVPVIDEVFFDAEGEPEMHGSSSVAKFKKGAWEYTPVHVLPVTVEGLAHIIRERIKIPSNIEFSLVKQKKDPKV